MRNSLPRAALILLTATALWGQDAGPVVEGGPDWKGFSVRFVVKVEPPGPSPAPFDGSVIDAGVRGTGAAQRIIDDRVHKRSFGYDLWLDPSADGATAQLRIEPLKEPQNAGQQGWTQFGLPSGLPKYPVIPNLRAGDTVAVDLLVNPATGQKIVDYLTLEHAPVLTRLHDFSLNDVLLTVDRPRIVLDGKLLQSTANFQGGAAGAVAWIYLEGRGRYVLSLFPHQSLGFQKSGMAWSNTLTFHDGASEFRVECSSAVAPGDGPYNLYVFHQPVARPHLASDPVEVGAAGEAESVLGLLKNMLGSH